MDLIGFVFGERPRTGARAPTVSTAPTGVVWRQARPREKSPRVHAELADHDGALETRYGRLSYRRGAHYIVRYGGRDRAVVKRNIFERLYEETGDGYFAKRRDVVLRYFTLPYDAFISGPEGQEFAKAGDWIMEGVEGEIYPIARGHARRLYETI